MSNSTASIEGFLRSTLGEDVWALINGEGISDVALNEDGALWVKRNGAYADSGLNLTPEQAGQVVRMVANSYEIDSEKEQSFSCQFPLFHGRFQGALPPVVARPVFVLRKYTVVNIPLEKFVERQVITALDLTHIHRGIEERKSFLVAGATGSGKTTVLCSLLNKVWEIQKHRMIVIEDTPEIVHLAPRANITYRRTSPGITQKALLKSAMREDPDRIILGEVRDQAAYVFLMSMNTGHPGGMATIHANGAVNALSRFGDLTLQDKDVETIPKTAIGQYIDFVMYFEQIGGKRRLKEFIEVKFYDAKKKSWAFKRL